VLFTDVSSDRLVRALKKEGFRIIAEGKHIGMSNGTLRVTIPRHSRLNPYTIKAILKAAQVSERQLKELL